MSQIYKPLTSGGPIPPNIPTSFTEQTGSAVPAANIIIVDAFDSIENDVNGINTKGGAAAGDPPGTGLSNEISIYLTNRISVTGTTVGAATTTVTLYTPANSTAQTFKVLINGYDSANNETAGGELIGLSRKSAGGVLAVIGTNDTFDESDAGLVATDWDVISDGASLQAQFVGVAGRTIVWRALFEYTQSP